jgi:hypothetical protein
MVKILAKNDMRTIDNSGSEIFYDASIVVDIPWFVSDNLNSVLYAIICPRYGRQTYQGRRIDVVCCLTRACRVLGI